MEINFEGNGMWMHFGSQCRLIGALYLFGTTGHTTDRHVRLGCIENLSVDVSSISGNDDGRFTLQRSIYRERMGWSWRGDNESERGGRDKRLDDGHITSSFSVTPISITRCAIIKEGRRRVALMIGHPIYMYSRQVFASCVCS